MKAFLHGRRPAIASTTVLSLAAGSLVAMAVTSDGRSATSVSLHDAGVWVTGTSGGILGLFNTEIRQSVIGLVPHSQQFDVLQDGSTVILNDVSSSRVRAVDVAGAALVGAGSAVPTDSRVAMGGGVLAVTAPTGNTWIRVAAATPTGWDFDAMPDAVLGAGAAVAVGRTGTVYAASLTQSRLTSRDRGADSRSSRTVSELPAGAKSVAVTVVGDTPVMLIDGNRIAVPGHPAVSLPAGSSGARLQQVSDAASNVLVASDRALYSVSLESGKLSTVGTEAGTGNPAAPVRVGRCSYAAWGSRPKLLTHCDGTKVTVDPVGGETSAKLEFRVNRGRIVLNDVANGNTFLLDDPRLQLADWKSSRVRDDEADQDPNKTDSTDNSDIKPEDRNKPNRAPKAVDDRFGVRAGATVIMPVLANDGDPDGDVLTVQELSTELDQGFGTARIIENGKAIQFVTAPNATGTATFSYVVADGRQGNASAIVTVPVIDAGTNNPPRPLSASSTSSTAVVRGGRVVHNILKDWFDPDGDPLSLECPPATVGVLCSPDGQVTFQDARRQTSTKQLVFEVSDGRASAKSALTISIIAPGSMPPLARSDFVHAFVGRTLVARPLDNDTSFAKEPVRLAKVEGAQPTLVVTPNHDEGTINLTPTAAGTQYLSYQIASGSQTATGIIRVDVSKPGEGADPVAAPDSALVRTGQPALVDVLRNDVDPAGNVLVVTDVRSSVPGLTIEVLGHKLVRLSAEPGFQGPASIAYEIHAGAKSASSFILVRRHTDDTSNQPPLAKDDRVVARVGQPVYIGVLGNDVDPEAGQLELDPALVGADAAFRPVGLASADASKPVEAFVARDQVRLLAPAEPGTVVLSYGVIDPEGERASASITVQVIAYDAPNRAPQPQPVEARVLAGRSVTLDIPLPGIDPDGDPVRLEPVDSPAKGTLAITKENRLVYTAGPESGTYEFRYQVTDPGGLAGQASVLVGVAPPSLSPRPPVAVNDFARIRNDRDRVISIPVLVNDSDPDGDVVTLDKTLVAPSDLRARVAGEFVAVSIPRGSTEQVTMGYSITSAGGRDDALVSVTASATAPLVPPTAVDDFPATTGSGRTIDVAVLANDTNATGPVTELAVSARPGDVGPVGVASRLNARTVRITRTAKDQWATYTINDGDGGESKAFIFVPRNDNQPPRPVDPLPAFEIKAGTSRQLSIADFAVDPEGKRLELTNANSISASGVTISGVTRTAFVVKPTIASGKASVTFEVMDGTTSSDPAVRTSKISIVVDVLPIDEVAPVFITQRLLVEAGEARPVTLDLDAYTSAGPHDAGRFTYGPLTGRVSGLNATLTGGRGSILTVSARDAPVLTRLILTFKITLGRQTSVGRVEIEVVQTTRAFPRATDCSAGSLAPGATVKVDLTRCTVNPFPETPLIVDPANMRSAAGLAVARGMIVTVTVASAYSGQALLPYTVRDRLNRTASANIVFAVIGKPGPPGQPEIVTPLPGGGAVQLTWAAANANGGNIDYYTVRDTANGYSHRCVGAVTRCLIVGIDYTKSYTFTVAAHTVEQGDGQASAPVTLSPAAVPPENPRDLEVTEGDGRAVMSWTSSARGAPVASYTVTVRPAPSDGGGVFTVSASGDAAQRSTLAVGGLRNGGDYTFTVAAAARNGEKSAEVTSRVFTPFGQASAPTAPTAVSSGGLRGGQVTIGWDPANVLQATNGRLTSLRIVQGGTRADVVEATGAVNAGRMVVDGLDASGTYTFALQVTNSGGSTATSQAASATVEGKPGTPSWVSTAPGDGEAILSFVVASANGSEYKSISVAALNTNAGTERTLSVTPVAGQTAYTVVAGALTNGETYSFTVTACNISQCSEPATAPNTVVPLGLPVAPQPVVLVDRQLVTFSWDNPKLNGGTGLLSIAVTGVGYPTGACPLQTAGAGRCSFTGSWNTAYTMTITASTNGGTDTKTATGTVEPAATPIAPLVTAASDYQTVTFTWQQPDFRALPGTMTLEVTGTGYPGGCVASTTAASSCSFTGEWDTTYSLLITVKTQGGTDTSTASTRTVPAPLPTAPQPTGTATGQLVTFTWGDPNFNGLPGTMQLAVQGSGYADQCPTTAVNAGSCSFVGAWNGAYSLTITVQTAGGIDTATATALVSPPPRPTAPQPSGSISGRDVTFNWGAPDFNGLSGQMKLAVTGNGYPGGCPVVDTGPGSCTFRGEYSTTYTMTVTVDTVGGSDTKSTAVTIGSPPAPTAPQLTGAATGRDVTFSWGAPNFSGLPGTMTISVAGAGYPGGCPAESASAGSCSFTASYATAYTMTVTVTTAGGTDSASFTLTTENAPPPAAPRAPNVTGSATGRAVTFSWGAPQFMGLPGTMTISVAGTGYPGGCPAEDTGSGSCTFTGEYATAYTMTVTVTTAGGTDTSSHSVTTDAGPPPPTPPIAPKVNGSAVGREVTFTWGNPNFQGLPGTMTIAVTGPGYSGGCPAEAPGSGTCTFTGEYSSTVTMTVTVTTADGTDSSSDTVTTAGAPPPPAPTAPVVSGSVSVHDVVFTWGDPDFKGVAGTMSLSVDGAGYPPGSCPAAPTGSGTCSFTGDYSTTYRITITVTTAGGTDSSTTAVTTADPPPPPPSAPVVSGSVTDRDVVFTWGDPDYKGIAGTMSLSVAGAGYPPGSCPDTPTGSGTCTFTGDYSTAYTITITVTTAGGTDSSTTSVTTADAPPPTPTDPPLP